MRRKPYTCADIAAMRGVTADHFRRHIADYFTAGLPAPLPGPGQRRWDRAQVDAWRNGRTLPQPANDAVELEARTDDDHRARLHASYGRFGLTGS